VGIATTGAVHLPGAPYYLAALFVLGAFTVCWQVTRPPEPVLAE